jgi:gluconate 5-dehydrogenase
MSGIEFPSFDLTGHVALVTGSSQGIGRALAEGIGGAGATVVLNGRNEDRLSEAVERLRNVGITAQGEAFDVTDSAAVSAGVMRITESIGTIDILVNNAGTGRRKPFVEMSNDDWSSIIESNLTSAFKVSRAVAPLMVERGWGRIINTCSLMSSIARKNNANYAASKGGLAMLTNALCIELGEHGITVNGIAPGYFDTPLTKPLKDDPDFTAWLENRTPLRRWGKVEELAGTAVFLASDAARFVTGQIIYVDGGVTASL